MQKRLCITAAIMVLTFGLMVASPFAPPVQAMEASSNEKREAAEQLVLEFWTLWNPPHDLAAVQDLVVEDSSFPARERISKGATRLPNGSPPSRLRPGTFALRPMRPSRTPRRRGSPRAGVRLQAMAGCWVPNPIGGRILHGHSDLGDTLDAGRSAARSQLGRAQRLGTVSAIEGCAPALDTRAISLDPFARPSYSCPLAWPERNAPFV